MKNQIESGAKVIIAMSGGVDSSVAAALLKKAGFDIIGVHLKFWSEKGDSRGNKCCTPESEKRARAVAKILDIPFYVVNFEKEFKKRVVDCFLKEIKEGKTPNPCVVCNKEIKFGLLLEKAPGLGVDFVATGHYARLRQANGQFKLLKGRDKNKDQSYFLWKLGQKQLSRILFPVGNYTKPEVRELARKFKLPVAETPESMEICFAPAGINDFLKKYLKTKPGDIVDVRGEVIGRHSGLAYYTIGQRKGIKLAEGPAFARLRRVLAGRPYFVLDKDVKKNFLNVTQNEKDLFKKEVLFKNQNWISSKPPEFPVKVLAKIRYRQKAMLATLKARNKLVFLRPQRAITPGQSVVFYEGRELLGGGIIL